MKIVLDNIIFSLQRAGGISGSWAILIGELLRTPGLEIYFLERRDALSNIFRAKLAIPAERIIPDSRLPLQIARYMPAKIQSDSPFIFHSSYYRTCSNKQARNVVTVHDFTYEDSGQFPWLSLQVHTRQKWHAIRHARSLVSVSYATQKRLHRFISEHNGSNTPYTERVIGNPPVCIPSSAATTTVTPPFSDGYLLFVGSRCSYKNFKIAAQAASIARLPLVIAGAPLTTQEREMLSNVCSDLQYSVVQYPSSEQLSILYTHALSLLYPSSYEGFGIPIIEAGLHGCPTLISECEACVEVGSDAVKVVSELSATSLAKSIIEMRDKPDIELKLRARINALKYTKEDIARSYLELYDALSR